MKRRSLVATTGPSLMSVRSSALRARACGDRGEAHGAGGATAARARTGPRGQHDRRGRTVGPPPADHALVRGRGEQPRVEGVRAGHRALRVGAGAADAVTAPRPYEPHSRDHGPLPCGREGLGRAELIRLPVVSPGQEPASPSEDLAHERSFLSVDRRERCGPSHHVSITSLSVRTGSATPQP